jgi:PIN domain nuclease of toxin-antitoxin system
MPGVVADTHAIVWYLSQSPALSLAAAGALDNATQSGEYIYVSAITVVETVYLVEKGRLPEAALSMLTEALEDPATVSRLVPIDLGIAEAMRAIPRDEVPDMPDRIIAATALQLGVPLVTRDRRIRNSQVNTIW